MTWEPTNLVQHRLLARRRPRERPHHPRSDQRRDVGADQLLLPLDAERRRPGPSTTPTAATSTARSSGSTSSITGISEGTMSHGEAWEFFQLGKYLERGLPDGPHPRREVSHPAAHARAHRHARSTTPTGWPSSRAARATSRSTSSGRAADPGIAVADFLIFDSIFPRSVRFCLGKCRSAGVRDLGTAARPAGQ